MSAAGALADRPLRGTSLCRRLASRVCLPASRRTLTLRRPASRRTASTCSRWVRTCQWGANCCGMRPRLTKRPLSVVNPQTAAYAAGGVILCLRLNLRLTFVVVLCVLPTVALSRLARHALRATGNASSAARAEVLAAAETSLLSAELVRAYGMERPEAAIFRQAVARSVQANEARMGFLCLATASCPAAGCLLDLLPSGAHDILRAGPRSLHSRRPAASASSWAVSCPSPPP